ncbi:hypothetical protein [Klebsiella grimontii]|uniref:hypothetical protein n=1 Tax=Klebsiella grimontii TaxID=2058152 RepID=UPI002114E876|nr:hypothetical protein [Klebsiella grimontii]
MTDITKLAQLRKELSNPAIGSKDHLRKIALSLVEALEKAQQHIAELESRTVTVKPMRPGHITVGGEKLGIYMRDEVDEFLAALTAAGIKWEAE